MKLIAGGTSEDRASGTLPGVFTPRVPLRLRGYQASEPMVDAIAKLKGGCR